jgi:transposase-like protein
LQKDFLGYMISIMDTKELTKLQKKVKIAMIRRGYEMPGDKARLAKELGVSPQQLSMALHMYRSTKRYREILEEAAAHLGQ